MTALMLTGIILPVMAQAGEFRFPIGLTYVSGAQKVMDKMKDNYYISDDFVLPVGLAFNPYYESDLGLGFGINFGPMTYMGVDTGDNTDSNIIIPIGADIRYTFFRKSDISPYIKAGFRYPIASGDYLDSKSAGLFGGAGVEFLRTRKISLGIEVSYDDSKIKVKSGATGARPGTSDQEVTPCGFMVGVYAVF